MAVEQLTFTVLRPGEGYNRALNGYQIKACSPGMTEDERQTVSDICVHYGGPVYADAPRAAHEKVRAYVDERKSCDNIPASILDEFPPVWSYASVGEDRFALTCVRYIGFTHEPRPGNFFGHSLVFDAAGLQAVNFNPLGFAATEWMKSNDVSAGNTLEPLSEAQLRPAAAPDLGILRQERYSTQISPMLCALANAPRSGRPVVLCLPDWRDAVPLVEALLYGLPPGARGSTTFCTNDNDLEWKVSTRAGKPTPYQLWILCAIDGRPPRLSPHHYQTRAVFNFLENCDKAPRDVSVYSNFAATSLQDSSVARLQEHHVLAAKLGSDRNVDAWDTLVSALCLTGTPGAEELTGAIRAVCRVSAQAAQARVGVEQVWPHVARLTDANDAPTLTAVSADLAALCDRLPDGDVAIESSAGTLASGAFAHGHGRTAAALLKGAGRRRDAILKGIVQALPPTTIKDETDAAAIVDLLLDGLRLVDPPANAYLAALLAAAKSVRRCSEIWKIVGESMILPRLTGDWTASQTTLAREAIEAVSGACPEAEIGLRQLWIAHTNVKGEELTRELAELARAASSSPDGERRSREILELAKTRLEAGGKGNTELVDALGRFAASTEDTPCQGLYADAYRDEMVKVDRVEKRFEIRRRLVERGGARVVCAEFFRDVLPWNPDPEPPRVSSRKAFKEWEEHALRSSPQLLETVLAQTVQRLATDAEELGRHVLAKWHINPLPPVFATLYERGVLGLPLSVKDPVCPDWLDRGPQKIGTAAEDRRAILTLLSRISELSKKSNWSLDQFKFDEPAWARVRDLPLNAREDILGECLATVEETGITSASDASKFVGLLSRLGWDSPEDVGSAAWAFIKSRDEVTQVNVVRAFTQNHFDKPGNQAARIVGAIVKQMDRSTRRLFEAHLDNGFGRRGDKYHDKLEELCEAAGLAKPAGSAKPKVHEPTRTEPTPASSQSIADRLTDTASSVRTLWGKLKSGVGPGNKK